MTPLLPTVCRAARGMDPARPIRVSFVIDNLNRAGTETQLLALIRHLDRACVEPSFILLDGDNATSRALEPECPVLRLGVKKLLGFRATAAAARLRRYWSARRPDVVQAYFLDSAYFAVPLARVCGVPRVVRVRNNLGYWLTRKHRVLNRLLRPLVDVTLTNSDTGRARLEDEGLPPDRIAVLENGVDVSAGENDPADNSCVTVGCVANLRPVKNLAGLLRAAEVVLARHPNARFEVAGDGEQRAELERLRDSLGLADRFHFRGALSDVPGFLRSVSVAVLPSHSEGMSNAVLEYMAAGKAVVATDVGANRTVLGEAGLLIPAGDDAALADAIGGLIADPGCRVRLGAAARERAVERYGRAAMARRFEAFYRELVTHRGTPGRVRPSFRGSLFGRARLGSTLPG